MIDPRIPLLAKQVTGSAANNYDKVNALQTYLLTHFSYSLQLPRTVVQDPLATFLFERKQGHCEYFASSMAVMLRTLGIPSRVVNGFRAGEFNDLTSQYLVRASNAHSWVEAYFPGYGWVAFDPTPGASIPIRTGWSRVVLYIDALASFWRDWVVNYDASHQQTLALGVKSGSHCFYEALRHWMRRHYESLLAQARHTHSVMAGAPGRWGLAGALIAMTFAFVFYAEGIFRILRKHRLAARPARYPRQAATIWYERMTRLVEQRGWPKSPTQTASEFVCRIEDVILRERVAKFTRHYESARFDDSAEDVRCLPRLYKQISVCPRH